MIEIYCNDCGSTDVRRDAWAVWDVDQQDWVLGSVFDEGHCEACEDSVKLAERPILRLVGRD